jgi:hypothetical protein
MSKDSIDMKAKIEKLLNKVQPEEQINIIESLGKKYRRLNSIRINDKQMGRKPRVESRPDDATWNE